MTSQPQFASAWLVSDGRVLASADVALTPKARRQGVIGKRRLDGAMVIIGCKWIHSVGVKVALDVAYLDSANAVIKMQRVKPMRIALPVARSRIVVEAAAGSFARWGLKLGDIIEVRDTHAEVSTATSEPAQ